MTEPFAEEHAPEVAASEPLGGRPDPSGAGSEPSGAGPESSGAGTSGVDHEPGAEPESAAGEPEEEVVDGFPVLAEVRTVERVSPASLPAVQAAAAAATGFVAGAATVALVRRRHTRKLARNAQKGPRRVADLLPITASRSFLVDVHVIGKQGD